MQLVLFFAPPHPPSSSRPRFTFSMVFFSSLKDERNIFRPSPHPNSFLCTQQLWKRNIPIPGLFAVIIECVFHTLMLSIMIPVPLNDPYCTHSLPARKYQNKWLNRKPRMQFCLSATNILQVSIQIFHASEFHIVWSPNGVHINVSLGSIHLRIWWSCMGV